MRNFKLFFYYLVLRFYPFFYLSALLFALFYKLAYSPVLMAEGINETLILLRLQREWIAGIPHAPPEAQLPTFDFVYEAMSWEEFNCSPNYSLDDHVEASFLNALEPFLSSKEFKDFVFGVPDSNLPQHQSGESFMRPGPMFSPLPASKQPPVAYVTAGFEKCPLYLDRHLPFIGVLDISSAPGRSTAVAIDFSDYMLGRPRTIKEWLELAGFAFSAFCGGKALEAYCLQHGIFRGGVLVILQVLLGFF